MMDAEPGGPPSADQPSRGARLGRYALGRSLGRGGMGEVFRARAFGAAGVVKELCVKRIRPERLARAGALEQFVAEARLWMRLHHGNIVPVFDFGRAGAEYYLAMEWVDGADVRALVADARESGEPLPASTAAHVAGEVARALAYAHSVRDERGHGVVHRDVKPANVLVSRSGDVRLTDFGVAAAAPDAVARGGTPAYMAPEQLRGEATDARADLYALGIVLHELLAGARPVGRALALPSTTPRDIAELVTALLREDADARPDSAAAVARTLEAAVGRARAQGDEPSPRDELGRRAARIADQQRDGGTEPSGELSADASFVDTSPDALPSLTHSTVTGAPPVFVERRAPAAPAAAPPRAARSATRLAATVVLATASVATLALAAYGALREPRSAHDSASPPDAPAPRSAAHADAARARDERSADESAARSTHGAPSRPATTLPAPAPSALVAATAPTVPAFARHLPTRPPRAPLTEGVAPAAAAAPALLNVNAAPWAALWVDGAAHGTTPVFGLALTPGRHELRFVNAPLGVERETTVTLAPGERRDLVVDLAPAPLPTEPRAVIHVAREK